MHIQELNRLGAEIKHEGLEGKVMGTEYLQGAPVMAIDCVLFVSLVIAALLSCSIGWSRGETIAIILIVDLRG